MKKLIIFSLLSVMALGAFSKTLGPTPKPIIKADADSLKIYTGRFQSVQKQGTFLVETFLTEDGRLLAHSLWDGNKYPLIHLKGDNFIMQGFDWSVHFIKNKESKVTRMLVKGTEYWDKIKDL